MNWSAVGSRATNHGNAVVKWADKTVIPSATISIIGFKLGILQDDRTVGSYN